MGKKLYVGNLDYGVTDSALEQVRVPLAQAGRGSQ